MTDAHVIGTNSPLVPFVKITFDGFTTGCLPPKFVQNFSTSRVRDKTGTYELSLIYAPDTFKPGDDKLGLQLANTMAGLHKEATATDLKVNCTLEYGWYGAPNARVKFDQAVISGFSETVENNAVIYNIKGVLNNSSVRAMKTTVSAVDLYDLDNDGDVDIDDYALAIGNTSGDIWKYLYDNDKIYGPPTPDLNKRASTLTLLQCTKIPAGYRLSDCIEALAKYIFKGIYNIEVDHSDATYNEDTDITNILTDGYKVNSGETLLQKLQSLVNCCYTSEGYEVTVDYYLPGADEAYASKKISIESDESDIESIMYTNIPNGTDQEGVTIIAKNGGKEFRDTVATSIAAGTVEAKEKSRTNIKGDKYNMYFIDYSNRYNLPTLKIGPITDVYSGARFAHYQISNKNRYNNVISCSHSTDLIPIVTAFNYVTENGKSDVDADTGEIIRSNFAIVAANLTKDKLESTAEDYAMQIISHLDNTATGSLSVVFDNYSAMFGIDDMIYITNTVNSGSTMLSGNYYITAVTDSLNGGMLQTDYSLIYHKSDIKDYVKSVIVEMLQDLMNK